MLFVLYLKEYTWLLGFSIIESQKNDDNTIIASQIITVFMTNRIIAQPYMERGSACLLACMHAYHVVIEPSWAVWA